MKLIRLVVSDLHIGTGLRSGELNRLEDFVQDERFADLLSYYDRLGGDDTEIELILNGDIFDLLKVKVAGRWPTQITREVAAEKIRQCLEGHPVVVRALKSFLSRARRRITYLPGNHDLDMWWDAPQEIFRRYVAPGPLAERVTFVTATDTYYLPEGIQIRHGHQLERIHRVDYRRMTRRHRDGTEVLVLPWGSLWILEVMNPAKEERPHVDRIQPLGRFLLGALLFDTRFAVRFLLRSTLYFLRRRVFAIRAWRERLRNLPRMLREDIFDLGGFDLACERALARVRGAHTMIVGHSHGPRFKQVRSGKLLVNTGTWIKMINLDIQYVGQDSGLTYALIEYTDDGRPQTQLMRWYGRQVPCETVPYAD